MGQVIAFVEGNGTSQLRRWHYHCWSFSHYLNFGCFLSFKSVMWINSERCAILHLFWRQKHNAFLHQAKPYGPYRCTAVTWLICRFVVQVFCTSKAAACTLIICTIYILVYIYMNFWWFFEHKVEAATLIFKCEWMNFKITIELDAITYIQMHMLSVHWN